MNSPRHNRFDCLKAAVPKVTVHSRTRVCKHVCQGAIPSFFMPLLLSERIMAESLSEVGVCAVEVGRPLPSRSVSSRWA